MSLAKLQNTTIMSTELTHARLKHLAAKIGVTEEKTISLCKLDSDFFDS